MNTSTILDALTRLATSWTHTRDPATLQAIDRALDALNNQDNP